MNQQVVVADTNADLSTAELSALRENLNEQRAFRLNQLAQLWQGASAPAQRARERAAIAQLEVRLQAVCLGPHGPGRRGSRPGAHGSRHVRHLPALPAPIEPARLRIVPQARYCGRCHQVREARS